MKNKHKRFFVNLLSLSSLFCIPLSVQADNAVSNSFLEYEEDTSITVPVDPTDPSTPLDPDKTPDGTEGPLSIDYVSNWNFDIHKISSKDQEYTIKKDVIYTVNSKKEVPNFFQVTDKSGELAGWTLYLQQDHQFTTGTYDLEGAVVKVKDYSIKTMDDGKQPSNLSKNITINPNGTPHPILQAKKGEGTGTWIGMFGDQKTAEQNITLTVPGKTKKVEAKYYTEFTWILVSDGI